jgi:hypothetical protein
VYEGKVSLIIGIHQIMVVLVDLNRCQLSLVDNVLVGKGADVEPILEPNSMGSPLPENIELSLEELLIKLLRVRHLGSVARAIRRLQHNEGLQNGRLTGGGSRTKERGVHGWLSPPQDPQAQALGNIFQLPLGLLQRLLIRLEKQIPHSILARRRKLNSFFALKVLDKELVRNGGHDTRAVAVSCV